MWPGGRQQPPQGLPGGMRSVPPPLAAGKGGMAGMQGRGGAYPPPPMSRTPPMGPGGLAGCSGYPPQMGMQGMSGGPSASSTSGALSCTGCRNPTVSNIIKGTFVPDGSNHGKSVYRKDTGGSSTTVLIYYWDQRDGPNFSGWWFGPKVGGDQVWAYNAVNSQYPPPDGWKVPWDGPEDDSLKLHAAGGSHGSSRQDSRYRDDGRREENRYRDDGRREAERSRRDEEDRWKQKQREEEMQRQAEAQKRRRDEEDVRRREQNATLAVRKVIQRLRMATQENYSQLRQELAEAQEKHLEEMGSQAEKVSAEGEKALQQAQERVEELKRKEEEDERWRQEQERMQKEESELVEKLVKEASGETEAADTLLSTAEESSKQIPEGADVEPEAIITSADVCIKSAEAAQASLESASKSLEEKWDQVKKTHLRDKAGGELQDMRIKLREGKRTIDKILASAKAAQERATRKSAAAKKLEVRKAKFDQVDCDGDGVLNLDEACAFAKSEYDFELSEDTQQHIMRILEPISLEKFQRLRGMVAIAKSEFKAREKRAEEEERQRVFAEMKADIQSILDEARVAVGEAAAAASKAEDTVKPLNHMEEVTKDGIQEVVETTEGFVKEAEESLQTATDKMQTAEEKCSGSDGLLEFTMREMPPLKAQQMAAVGQVEYVRGAIQHAQGRAIQKAYAELEEHRSQAATAMRAFMNAEKKSGEDLFTHVVGDGSVLDKEKWIAFLGGLPDMNLSTEQVDKLFSHVAGEENADLSQEAFVHMLRAYFKCINRTVMNEELSIKSKQVKRLDVGEILEALEGPSKDDGAGVIRYRCQSMTDKAMGWVTVAGNQGTSFLEPGGNLMTCVKETIVTDDLSVQDSNTLRRVVKGEVVELIEFPKKDEGSGVSRIRGKMKLDGVTGWISVSSNQGSPFLEPC